VSMQNHYNLAYREEEREMMPLCTAEGIGIIPWSPLARGLLTGSRPAGLESKTTVRAESDDYARTLYENALDMPVVEGCAKLAKSRGLPMAQIALAWLLHQPAVVAPIVGATKPAHLADAIAAVDVTLSVEERAALDERYQPHRVLGHL